MFNLCVLFALVVWAGLGFEEARGELLITEFLAVNGGPLADEDGEFSDWIELYNTGPGVLSLDGYHLTENAAELDKWEFPPISLEPGEYLVVFASNKDRDDPAGELHTNFRLSGSGEYLALVAPDGSTVQQAFAPAFPPQFGDVSYGLGTTADFTGLVGDGASLRAHVPGDDVLGLTWTERGFDDAAWLSGVSGAGFETESGFEPEIGLDLQAGMFGVSGSVYLRAPFTVANPAEVDSLALLVKYDD